MRPAPEGYRPNVGMAVFNTDGLVLLCKRADTDGPHAWQLPQGGVDPGEAAETAARRELEEETGIGPDLINPLGRTGDWLTYDFPAALRDSSKFRNWKGQAQLWFAYRFTGQDADIVLDAHTPEFDAWRWDRLAETPFLVIPWKRPVYEKVAEAFADFAL